MKQRFLITILVIAMFSGCKKFLNVDPLDSLSGNNFWKTRQDAETYTREVYRLFREGVAIRTGMILVGDLRCAPVAYGAYPPRGDFNLLSSNSIRTLVNTPRIQGDINTYWQVHGAWDVISDWTPIYKVVQAANVLYEKAPDVAEADQSMSAELIRKYQAEAVFMRCLSYFFMIRLFGDVPYYTNAYNDVPLPRTKDVEVAKACIAELEAHRNDLPWTYEDPANRAVRAMRGSAIALEMDLNMWLAGIDEANKKMYYEETDRLGDELTASNAYKLLPMENIAQVFAGRSEEGLFEVPQNVNYGDVLGNIRRTFTGAVLHYPYIQLNQNSTKSELTYTDGYLKKLYPEEANDLRKKYWFDNNIYNEDGTMQCFKFFNLALGENNTTASLSNYFIIFRYAGALLLQAEALANLEEGSQKAEALLNQVRTRAGADLYSAGTDKNLPDAIFYERSKELMGEGHYYYDLVRSRKIYNPDYCYRPISYGNFVQGAWLWPISEKALVNNPHMTLNNYWR
ncbi:RagB/SusD family nutrient uptake outer membrane protein [Niabella beijingensis]|uniref:RagB/SusD family nutrient uptake outer membrane protein n=1 Tax=Niabella beijingensis TaxID=2872700 RepID=UPI001CC08E5C|nr:RagB/SusD family nutrient uptake outer membrane protein [Niabella beijingensis]MBZ4188305.1 RagB/SusD family nutrient uptake outer membrane protein [Niabella beijingensis]